MMEIRGLTVRQPWATAIARWHKRIENRGWACNYRGLLAIHAGSSVGGAEEFNWGVDHVINLARIPKSTVLDTANSRSVILAVARLETVCAAGLNVPWSEPLGCSCGQWAFRQQRHFKLADVKALRDPVPCTGGRRLWRLPADVEAAVRGQLTRERVA